MSQCYIIVLVIKDVVSLFDEDRDDIAPGKAFPAEANRRMSLLGAELMNRVSERSYAFD